VSAGDRVDRARSVRSATEATQLYREWADDYDHDVFDVLGFTGTDRIADLLAEHVPDRSTRVLDLGCGTGAAGRRLREHGFGAIDGVDISPEMLRLARRSGAYAELVEADLTERPLLHGRYGASVSAGTFTGGHVGAGALEGIATWLQPGATVAWVVAAGLWPAFRVELGRLGLHVVAATLEPVRRDGPAEAMMVVARSGSPGSAT
jgi:SAM-dependent methyltransferase